MGRGAWLLPPALTISKRVPRQRAHENPLKGLLPPPAQAANGQRGLAPAPCLDDQQACPAATGARKSFKGAAPAPSTGSDWADNSSYYEVTRLRPQLLPGARTHWPRSPLVSSGLPPASGAPELLGASGSPSASCGLLAPLFRCVVPSPRPVAQARRLSSRDRRPSLHRQPATGTTHRPASSCQAGFTGTSQGAGPQGSRGLAAPRIIALLVAAEKPPGRGTGPRPRPTVAGHSSSSSSRIATRIVVEASAASPPGVPSLTLRTAPGGRRGLTESPLLSAVPRGGPQAPALLNRAPLQALPQFYRGSGPPHHLRRLLCGRGPSRD
ncbi:hypothetical protein NDU88_009397 [Pleurodeles waltl]|uniref:Uncharacterized protein n=1 Tax=Pleurodeles waltl TaxID=8319 RepID=A0AAV7QRH5_PLEWA|nr:hypothetical protein NDU88_009397 [Pleurodeles waltl]